MREMKNFLKNNFLGFFIGIIFSFVFIFTMSIYIASNPSFSSKKISLMIENSKLTDGSLTSVTKKYPVGEIITYMGTHTPNYYLACDGTTYNIVDYPLLASHIETEFGSKNFFGGNGTTTFAVPDLRGKFLRGTGTNSHTGQGNGSSVGTHQAASLPNLKGRFVTSLHATNTAPLFASGHGAFLLSGSSWEHSRISSISGATNVADSDALFDASRSSSVYQDDAEVRPTNTSVLYAIRYE